MAVLVATHLAGKKSDFKRHRTILRIAITLQLVTIAGVMLPLILGFIERGQRGLLFNTEMLVHHTLELTIVTIWVFINLLFMGIIRIRVRCGVLSIIPPKQC